MPQDRRYSFLEDNRFSREKSYGEKRLRELYQRGVIGRNTELWLWDGDDPHLAGTYETLFIRGRSFKERRLGVFGVSGCGKTSFLACCTHFGKTFDDNSIIVYRDEDRGNGRSLKAAWNRLEGGKAVEPTEEISTVDFSLLHDGAAWEVRTVDPPGNSAGRNPSDRLDDWTAESDALLLFVDGRAFLEKSGKNDEEIEELRRFLDHQRQHSPHGNRIDKPMAVVVTKADLLGYPESDAAPLAELRAVVGEFGDCTACFAVSVLDGAKDAPYGVAEPLHWAVREIDRRRLESAPKTLTDYRSLRDVWGINSGEPGRRVETEIRRLETLEKKNRKTARRLWGLVWVLILGIAAVFVLDSLTKRNYAQYRIVTLAIENAHRHEDVEEALKNYRKGFFTPSKLAAEVEALASEKLAELAAQRAEIAYRTARLAIHAAETPTKIDVALEKFRTETAGHGDRYRTELEELAAVRHRELRFRFALKKMKYDLGQAESFARSKRIYDEFLDNFSEAEYPGFADRIREARSDRDRLIAEEREGVEFLPPTAFYEKINRLDEQIMAFGIGDPQRKTLEDDREKIAARWEPEDYRKFREAALNPRTAGDLRRADELAGHYLEQSALRTALRIANRYEKPVRTWKAWFDGLKNPHRVELSIESVLVPKSFFQDRENGATAVFTLQAGKTKAEYVVTETPEDLEKSDPVRFEPDLRCAVEDAVWDENKATAISLTIAQRRGGWRSWVWSGPKAVCQAADSEYPYIEFRPRPDGKFSFPAGDDSTVTVTTEAAISMPELPEE